MGAVDHQRTTLNMQSSYIAISAAAIPELVHVLLTECSQVSPDMKRKQRSCSSQRELYLPMVSTLQLSLAFVTLVRQNAD